MKRTISIIVSIVFVFALLALLSYSFYFFFIRTNDKAVPAFDESKLNLVIGGEEITAKAGPKLEDGEVLLPIDVVKKYFDPNINWDEKSRKVTVTTKDRVIRMKTDNLQAMINNKPITLNIPVIEQNGTVYIPIEFLSEFYGIEVNYLKENNVIVIDHKNTLLELAEPVDQAAVVRRGRSTRYPVIRRFDPAKSGTPDNTMRIFEEYDKWYKVRTSEGAIGYIEKRYVVVRRMMAENGIPEDEKKNELWKPASGKINLVWEQVWAGRLDTSKINGMQGLDIVSPTWFTLQNDKGQLSNRADPKFVEWAHKNGYKVWALLSNDFSNVAAASRFLRDTDARDNLIKEILAYSALYKLDGINIDFESMPPADKDYLSQFVRELAPFLREQGLVVSVDINEFAVYDRKALADAVDYVAVMAYDQHWKGSTSAGSVAQLSWVEGVVNSFLKTVPKEKFLLGLPFYTRLWKEEKGPDGKVKLSSEALSMEAARKKVAENNASVKWDESSGQFYSEYLKDGSTYKVWLEDANSINLRASLIQKYKLAGAASWSRNFAEPAVWEVLNRDLKVLGSYHEWVEQNSGRNYVYNN